MSPPLVSIVVNNFNYARFLPRSVDSALSQQYPKTEVIVVDDGSTDGSRDVIRGYGERVVPVLKANGGQGSAVHAGFARSRGDVVMFLDADDYLYPTAAARVAGALAPGVAQIQFRLDLIDAAGRKVDLFPAPEIAFDDGDVAPLLLSRGRYETSVTSGIAFARPALAAVLPMPEEDFRLAADGYLATVTPLYGRVVSIEEPLGAYCQHGGNRWALTSTDAGERFRRALAHDAARYAALERKAAERGLRVAPRPGLNDHFHLSSRIASLCLDPANHPDVRDTRMGLALHGVRAARAARLNWKRRALLAVWFLCAGLLPRPMARRAVAWRLMKPSRPPAVDRTLGVIRRILR